jgi:8-oxo-dGTP pyrophosphatase MutT (NUDIX family)
VKPLFRPRLYVPLACGGRRIGWLRPELAARLGQWSGVFKCSPDQVVLLDHTRLDPIIEQLARDGFIRGWRNERYRIADLFEVERAAALPFGFPTNAVHLNGICGERMWLGRRSASKQTDPGMLDNVVAGGISAGSSPLETLIKECREEAGIPGPLARKAVFSGTLHVLREVPQGVQSETLHVFDLELPPDFQPRNQDGEVSEFKLLSFAEIDFEQMTYDAALAARDYLKRARAP